MKRETKIIVSLLLIVVMVLSLSFADQLVRVASVKNAAAGAVTRFAGSLPGTTGNRSNSGGSNNGTKTLTGATMSYPSHTLQVGRTMSLSSWSALPGGSQVSSRTFSSSNAIVATVNNSGVITAKSTGTAVIVMTLKQGSTSKTASWSLTVVAGTTPTPPLTRMPTPAPIVTTSSAPISSVSLSYQTHTVEVGKSINGMWTIQPTNATADEKIFTSSNSNVARVSSRGEVTGVKPGNATIKLTVKQGSRSKTATFSVTVVAATNTPTTTTILTPAPMVTASSFNVFFESDSEEMGVRDTLHNNLLINGVDRSNVTITYSSSNKNIVTVTDSGVVTGKKAGTAIITAKVQIKGTTTYKTATFRIVVVDSLPINTPSGAFTAQLDKTMVTLYTKETASIKGSYTGNGNTTVNQTYTSSNTGVATVSSSGLITGKKAGTAIITYRAQISGTTTYKTATCTVTVRGATNTTGIPTATPFRTATAPFLASLDRSSVSLSENQTVQLKGTYTGNQGASVTETYTSSNTSVATVSSSGKVTAKKVGNATISYRVQITGTTTYKTATCTVTVRGATRTTGTPTVTPFRTGTAPLLASLDRSSVSLSENQTVQLNGTYTGNQGASVTETYTSSNTSVATVSSSGRVTAKKVGNAIITYRVQITGTTTYKTAACIVTVGATATETASNHLYKTDGRLAKNEIAHWQRCVYSGCNVPTHKNGTGIDVSGYALHDFDKSKRDGVCRVASCKYKCTHPDSKITWSTFESHNNTVVIQVGICSLCGNNTSTRTVNVQTIADGETTTNHYYTNDGITRDYNQKAHWFKCLYPGCRMAAHLNGSAATINGYAKHEINPNTGKCIYCLAECTHQWSQWAKWDFTSEPFRYCVKCNYSEYRNSNHNVLTNCDHKNTSTYVTYANFDSSRHQICSYCFRCDALLSTNYANHVWDNLDENSSICYICWTTREDK